MWCSSRRREIGPGGLGRGGHGLGSATRPCSRLASDMCIKNTVHKFLECSAIGCCSFSMRSGAVGPSMRSSAVTVAKGGMYQSDHGIYHALYHETTGGIYQHISYETKGGIYRCICHGIYYDIYHGIYLFMEDGIYHGIYHLGIYHARRLHGRVALPSPCPTRPRPPGPVLRRREEHHILTLTCERKVSTILQIYTQLQAPVYAAASAARQGCELSISALHPARQTRFL